MCHGPIALYCRSKYPVSGDISGITAFDDRMWHYIGPTNKIVGGVLHRHDHWVRYYFIWEIHSSCVFDEDEERFTARQVPPQGGVGFKVMVMSLCAVVCFLSCSNEEQVKCVDKPLGAAGAGSLYKATENPRRTYKDRQKVCAIEKKKKYTICISFQQDCPSGS